MRVGELIEYLEVLDENLEVAGTNGEDIISIGLTKKNDEIFIYLEIEK